MVRKGKLPGNCTSLWQAVQLAKNLGTSQIPKAMSLNGIKATGSDISNSFADFFEKKVNDIVTNTIMDENVYNASQISCTYSMAKFHYYH